MYVCIGIVRRLVETINQTKGDGQGSNQNNKEHSNTTITLCYVMLYYSIV